MEFRVLGSIEVVENGSGPIALGGPKQRAVLAHLLLRANHLVPTDVLIDEVWGEEPPETVRNALQSYASHLRKALGAERLEGSRAGYRPQGRTLGARCRSASSRSFATRGGSCPSTRRRPSVRSITRWICGAAPPSPISPTEPSLRSEAARLDELRLAALEERIEAQLDARGTRRGDR